MPPLPDESEFETKTVATNRLPSDPDPQDFTAVVSVCMGNLMVVENIDAHEDGCITGELFFHPPWVFGDGKNEQQAGYPKLGPVGTVTATPSSGEEVSNSLSERNQSNGSEKVSGGSSSDSEGPVYEVTFPDPDGMFDEFLGEYASVAFKMRAAVLEVIESEIESEFDSVSEKALEVADDPFKLERSDEEMNLVQVFRLGYEAGRHHRAEETQDLFETLMATFDREGRLPDWY